MSNLIKRIYHPYWLWEEAQSNMYGDVDNRDGAVSMCLDFMNDTARFGSAMERVIEEWLYSCEHNLSNYGSNRRAWLGWAACAIEINMPEDIVRETWGLMDEELQVKANQKADDAIIAWEENYKEACYAQEVFEL